MKISIVTIHLNDFAGLGRSLNSLKPVMGDPNVEWVFIDGGSSTPPIVDDDVLARVKCLANHFISEPDEGIYDAMNKGTRLATGDYILYLNAGDELCPDFDPAVLGNLALENRPEMIWGRCLEQYQNGKLIQIKTRSPSWAWYGMPVYHPAIFFRKDVLGDNPYDTRYRIAADYELVCRLLSGDAQVLQLDSTVSIFHRGGLSEVFGNEAYEEENDIRFEYFRIPAVASRAITNFKRVNARLARIGWFRRLWRRWI